MFCFLSVQSVHAFVKNFGNVCPFLRYLKLILLPYSVCKIRYFSNCIGNLIVFQGFERPSVRTSYLFAKFSPKVVSPALSDRYPMSIFFDHANVLILSDLIILIIPIGMKKNVEKHSISLHCVVYITCIFKLSLTLLHKEQLFCEDFQKYSIHSARQSAEIQFKCEFIFDELCIFTRLYRIHSIFLYAKVQECFITFQIVFFIF